MKILTIFTYCLTNLRMVDRLVGLVVKASAFVTEDATGFFWVESHQ